MKLKPCIGALVAAGALVSSAAAYDRVPISVTGLTADGWGQSTTRAQRELVNRYPGVSKVYCTGIKLPNDPAESSWVTGTTRYWDKLGCIGRTYSTGKTVFGAIFDAKGAHAWILYRLSNVPLSALKEGDDSADL